MTLRQAWQDTRKAISNAFAQDTWAWLERHLRAIGIEPMSSFPTVAWERQGSQAVVVLSFQHDYRLDDEYVIPRGKCTLSRVHGNLQVEFEADDGSARTALLGRDPSLLLSFLAVRKGARLIAYESETSEFVKRLIEFADSCPVCAGRLTEQQDAWTCESCGAEVRDTSYVLLRDVVLPDGRTAVFRAPLVWKEQE